MCSIYLGIMIMFHETSEILFSILLLYQCKENRRKWISAFYFISTMPSIIIAGTGLFGSAQEFSKFITEEYIYNGTTTNPMTSIIKENSILNNSNGANPLSNLEYSRTLRAQRRDIDNKILTLVYVWSSEWVEGDGVGHVTLEIIENGQPGSFENNTFVSYFPYPDENQNPEVGIILDEKSKTHSFRQSYRDDFVDYGRSPDFLFSLNGLDTQAIKNGFKVYKSNPDISWKLFGDYFPSDSDKLTLAGKQSCVSLVAMLLDCGGVNKYLPNKKVADREAIVAAQSKMFYKMSREITIFKSPTPKMTHYIPGLFKPYVYILEKLAFSTGYSLTPDVFIGLLMEAKKSEQRIKTYTQGRFFVRQTEKPNRNRHYDFSYGYQNSFEKMVQRIIMCGASLCVSEWLPTDTN